MVMSCSLVDLAQVEFESRRDKCGFAVEARFYFRKAEFHLPIPCFATLSSKSADLTGSDVVGYVMKGSQIQMWS